MDPVKRAELRAQLKELKAEMKEKSLPGAKVTNGVPSEIRAFLAEVAKKRRAALREAYSNREPLILPDVVMLPTRPVPITTRCCHAPSFL